MIEIKLKNGELLYADERFYSAKYKLKRWSTESEAWVEFANYIIPINQVLYVKDVGDNWYGNDKEAKDGAC